MEFTVTEEFVREAHGAACSTWKTKIEKEFPDLFKTEFEVGRWYKFKFDGGLELISMITEIQADRIDWFGFRNNIWMDSDWSELNSINRRSLFTEAAHEEVESALIAEAKKRGFEVGVEFNAIEDSKNSGIINKSGKAGSFWALEGNALYVCGFGKWCVFKEGKWAEILSEEKTIITKGKALRIIAKKLKVSPESIEIQ